MESTPSHDLLRAKLAKAGIIVPVGRIRIDSYGDSPKLSQDLIDLIRSGTKRAGASLLWSHEHERNPVPRVGDLEIVLDHRSEPVLLTRVLSVEIVPFDQVTAAHAATEGEGDGSLQDWREGHWAFFARECARIGRAPELGMPVVCSVFELLAQVPNAVEQAPWGNHDLPIADPLRLTRNRLPSTPGSRDMERMLECHAVGAGVDSEFAICVGF